MTCAYLSLGSNLGFRKKYLSDAVATLAADPQVHFVRCSSLYETAPCLRQDQPDFLNAVLLIETSYTLAALGDCAQRIEACAGRIREAQPYGPRTLDIDILLFGEGPLVDGDFVVPHARLHERAFVLTPLFELASHLVIDGHGCVRDLLFTVAHQRCQKVDEPISVLWPNQDRNLTKQSMES